MITVVIIIGSIFVVGLVLALAAAGAVMKNDNISNMVSSLIENQNNDDDPK